MPVALWFVSAALATPANFVVHDTTIVERVTSFLGLFALIGIAWLMSERRSEIKWRPVVWAIGLQLVIGLVVLSPLLQSGLSAVNDLITKLLDFSHAGSDFVFGSIHPHMVTTGSIPDLLSGKGTDELFIGRVSPATKTFAFWILPTIIFFSTLSSVAYHLGILQFVVQGIAAVMMRTLGTSGAETLCTSANIFIGQTEAPLLIKPFLPRVTRSELMAIMTGGFATIAGGVLGVYAGFIGSIPNAAGHLIVASVLSAPATFALCKIVVPETEQPETAGGVRIDFPRTATNVIEAGANGAVDGVKLAINVAGVLLAAVAAIAMLDWMISFIPFTFCGQSSAGFGYPTAMVARGYELVPAACPAGMNAVSLSMADFLGWLFAPLAFLMGVPWGECVTVGRLLGEKLVLTEFTAYLHLGGIIDGDTAILSQRGAILAAYGLCGFSNFASIGIQIGGIGAMAPTRTGDLASLGMKAMIAGHLACAMTACIVGIII